MFPVWHAVTECCVRTSPPVNDMREPRENAILYVSCHRELPSEALQVGSTCNIQSRFSPHAVKYYRNQSAPVPLVLKHSNTGCGHILRLDIVRCRAQGWQHSASAYSVFICLDIIKKRTTWEHCVWNWLEKPACETSKQLFPEAPQHISGLVFSQCLCFYAGSW